MDNQQSNPTPSTTGPSVSVDPAGSNQPLPNSEGVTEAQREPVPAHIEAQIRAIVRDEIANSFDLVKGKVLTASQMAQLDHMIARFGDPSNITKA